MLESSQAVSESIGFILIVTIVFISFTTIFIIGYPIYNNYVESGHMHNIEKSFSLLAHNGNTVSMQKSTLSSSEMKMFDGTLATRDAGSMNISYYSDDAGTSLIGSSKLFNLSALEYSKGTARVAYVFGSVCKSDLNGAVMLREPEISCNGDMLLIPMINLYQSDVSIAGKTLTRITLMTPYYSKMYQTIMSPEPVITPGVHNVSITMTGDYAPGFSSYFQYKLGFVQSTGANGELILYKTYSQGIRLILTKSDVSISVN